MLSGTQTHYHYRVFTKANQEQATALFLLIFMLLKENWKKFTQEAAGNSVCPVHEYETISSAAYSQFRDEALSPDNQCTFQSYLELYRLEGMYSAFCAAFMECQAVL